MATIGLSLEYIVELFSFRKSIGILTIFFYMSDSLSIEYFDSMKE